jgi:hypothetical protein
LGPVQAFRDCLEPGLHGLDFSVLPKHYVAQFVGGPFQKGDLDLNLFKVFVVHRAAHLNR